MYRFFVDRDQISDGKAVIKGEDAHHIKNVLRMKKGENVYLSCGDEWEYECIIDDFSDDRVILSVADESKPGKELPCRITLYQCLPKKDKMELIIQKAVELGVYDIVPVESSRCIVRIDPKKRASRVERWNSIAKAAAKQSKRLIEPKVHEPVRFDDAVKEASEKSISFIPYERAEGMDDTRRLFSSIKNGDTIGIMIGPEGGFDESEIETAIKSNIRPITLGKRILRTETAGMAALSMLTYVLED